jgi:hypothetical protein
VQSLLAFALRDQGPGPGSRTNGKAPQMALGFFITYLTPTGRSDHVLSYLVPVFYFPDERSPEVTWYQYSYFPDERSPETESKEGQKRGSRRKNVF